MEYLSQILIPIFSCSSIWFLAGKNKKYGFLLGLCGQPFWIYSTYATKQWGMFGVTLWFTFNHLRGLRSCLKEKTNGV